MVYIIAIVKFRWYHDHHRHGAINRSSVCACVSTGIGNKLSLYSPVPLYILYNSKGIQHPICTAVR